MRKRTHHNNELRLEHVGQTVELLGWVSKIRNLGGLIFIDLRDRYGITQLVINPEKQDKRIVELAETIKNEYVIYARGTVIERYNKNKNLPTGDIEVEVEELEIISESDTTPLIIADDTDALEETRLKYRYLDLRRPILQRNILLRSEITHIIRNYLHEHDFVEIETPILTRSTPEGARDYLVPSRIHPGEFYALPQSPQIFKQLCMVAGFERYYQIARCFRDEDLRADRQPEFTQVDIEMSFVEAQDIQSLVEGMLARIMKEIKGIELKLPFDRITWYEAMVTYGSDKPDRRFGMELKHCNEVFKNTAFSVFRTTLEQGGDVRAINVKQGASKYSRKAIDQMTEWVKKYGAKGLAFLKYENGSFNGPIAKFLSAEEQQGLVTLLDIEEGDLILFVADDFRTSCEALGALRVHLAKELGLIDHNTYDFLWVVDWPLLEYDEEEGRYYALHHPFTSPKPESIDQLDSNPDACLASAYDIVLNGYELGGGSIRIHDRDLQMRMFKVLGFSEEEVKERFGFLLEAFRYGTPPHGGIALGLDRLVMILVGATSLRDVIAFPKTASASCLMSGAPSTVDPAQLKELHLLIQQEGDESSKKV